MSTLKVNKLRDTAGSTDAIVLDPNGGAVLAGVTTISTARITTGITTSIQVGGGVTISESGIEASGIGITCANINGAQIGGRRNLVINGSFLIDQRNNGAEVDPAVTNTYYPDRWSAHKDQANKFKIQRVSDDAPEGFKHALKCTVTNTHNPTGGNYFYISQKIEGNNIINLDMGESTAKEIAVSFFVKSSVTGVYSVAIRNNGYDCSAVGEYTISSANTWERKTINFSAANIGTWLTTNGVGLRLEFVLGAGSTYQTSTLLSFQSANKQASSNAVQWINNAGATFLLTGVQLEVGSQATAFEHRSFGEEFALCQRYYIQYDRGGSTSDDGVTPIICNVIAGDSNDCFGALHLPTCMRASPTLAYSSADHFETTRVFSNTNVVGGTIFIAYPSVNPHQSIYLRTNSSPNPSFSSGDTFNLRMKNQTASVISFSAEL